jgi:isoleucyl-tRNA synthetase
MYAEVDEWQAPEQLAEPDASSVLDQWMLSRLNQTIGKVTRHADAYQIMKAAKPIKDLIDDISNWYVRRSRRRFWKGGDDADKQEAYRTLHYVLVRTCQLLAPWAPFMSDYIYRQLRSDGMPPSVHLSDWPEAGESNQQLLEGMAVVRDLISEGLDQRAQADIKVRQPLARARIGNHMVGEDWQEAFADIIREELHVKELAYDTEEEHVRIDTEITPELKREGLARDIIRQVQQHRKEQELNVDDRIELVLITEDEELARAIEEHTGAIKEETLATRLERDGETGKVVHLEDAELGIGITVVSGQ